MIWLRNAAVAPHDEHEAHYTAQCGVWKRALGRAHKKLQRVLVG